MRDDLSEILYEAMREDIEYLFDDSISAVDDRPSEVRVEFDKREPRSFDLVIGADELRSNTCDLVFGQGARASRYLGAYLAVASVPNYLGLSTAMFNITTPRSKSPAMYSRGHARFTAVPRTTCARP